MCKSTQSPIVNYTIDQGNSFIKVASFEGDTLKVTYIWEHEQKVREYFKQIQNTSIIICSVSGNPDSLQNILRQHNTVLILDYKTQLPIVNGYKSPETLGMDRIASA